MLKDPLSIVGKEVIQVLNDFNADPKLKDAILKAINRARMETGNKTVYIQKHKNVVTYALEMWDEVYQIQVKNGTLTKSEVFKKISEEITSILGEKISESRVAICLHNREMQKKNLEKQLGLYEDDLSDF